MSREDETRKKRPEAGEEEDSGVRKVALIGGMSLSQMAVYVGGDLTILPFSKGMQTGDYILINPKTGAFDGKLKDLELPMQEMVVKSIINLQQVRAEVGGQQMILVKHPKMALEIGDHVAVDLKMPVVLRKLPKPEAKITHSVMKVKWEDVVGQDEAVRILQEIGEGFKYSSVAEFYGRKPPVGVLLFGPPGCGKTLLAQALATSIDSTGFFSIKGPEILSKWVGDSEEAIRQFFGSGRSYFQKTGKKAVLFIDEADALLQKRGRSGGAAFMSDTIVPQFLTEMNGLEESGTIVVLATNRPDTLDPAVVREGRISEKIHIKRPDQHIGKTIMGYYLKSRPLAEDLDLLAGQAMQTLFSTGIAKMEKDILTAGHYLSGALCAGIVEKSAGSAYQRNIMDKSSKKGITIPDIEYAAKVVAQGLRDLDHSDIIEEHGLR